MGEAGELLIAAKLLGLGYRVARTLANDRADLVVHNGRSWVGLQIKRATKKKDGSVSIALDHNRARSRSAKPAKYADGDFDFLVVSLAGGADFVFPWKEIKHLRGIGVTESPASKYARYREAWHLLSKKK